MFLKFLKRTETQHLEVFSYCAYVIIYGREGSGIPRNQHLLSPLDNPALLRPLGF